MICSRSSQIRWSSHRWSIECSLRTDLYHHTASNHRILVSRQKPSPRPKSHSLHVCAIAHEDTRRLSHKHNCSRSYKLQAITALRLVSITPDDCVSLIDETKARRLTVLHVISSHSAPNASGLHHEAASFGRTLVKECLSSLRLNAD